MFHVSTRGRQRSGDKKGDQSHSAINPNYTYLQKTLPGGIMLIELGFKDFYFAIYVYAFECSRLPVGKTVNAQVSHFSNAFSSLATKYAFYVRQ